MAATLICLAEPATRGKVFDLGECNLWVIDDYFGSPHLRVCVDLGTGTGLTAERVVEADPEILIVTHADLDHIGGFKKFSELVDPDRSSLRQIWLPYEFGLIWHAFAALVVRSAGQADSAVTSKEVRSPEVEVLTPEHAATLAARDLLEERVAAEIRGCEDGSDGRNEAAVRAKTRPLPGVTELGGASRAATQGDRGAGTQAEPADLLDGRASSATLPRPPSAHRMVAPEEYERVLRDGVTEADEASALDEVVKAADQLSATDLRSPTGDLKQARDDVAKSVEEVRVGAGKRPAKSNATGTAVSASATTLSALKLIVRIMSWSAQHGVRVRFFSTDAVSSESWRQPPWHGVGIEEVATLVNAYEVEIKPVTIDHPAEFVARFADITTRNRRALVTMLWDGPWEMDQGALIWSDSGGETCLRGGAVTSHDLVPWGRVRVMTAPHHGSDKEAHRLIWHGWENADGEARIPAIVSGGKPEGKFLDPSRREAWYESENRSCTLCRHDPRGRFAHQNVSAVLTGSAVFVQPLCTDLY